MYYMKLVLIGMLISISGYCEEITDYNAKLNPSLQSLSLKIDSCVILRQAISGLIKDKVKTSKIRPYVIQWVKKCTKTVEYNVNQPLLRRQE